ncbi:MAG: Hsp70 family protein [Oscillospiraceae bacterium]|nr:Hsp70 family protein [Oscillospiraceae bacterium]
MAIIGIDLGTTFSLATVWKDGKSELIPNLQGKYLTPSVVSVDEQGNVAIGEIAKQRLVSHPAYTAQLFKQFMGTKKEYELGGKAFNAIDLSSLILRGLKSDAESYLGERVTEAIVSVPAYFNDSQRAATKTAGELSGMTVNRIINEPSAAALAYSQRSLCEGLSLVVDFGGGTLDVSILDAFDNIVDIIAIAGDNHLGGSNIDAAIVEAFLQVHSGFEGNLSDQQQGILLKSAEMCKIALTDRQQSFLVHRHDNTEYSMLLDNERLMQICSPMLLKLRDTIKRALQNGEKTMMMIDNVILVGGTCRMPLVKEYLQNLLRKQMLSDIDPDFAVAIGAGVAAGIKSRSSDIRDMVLTDVCPFSLGVDTRMQGRGGVFDAIIPRNTTLPASRVHEYTTVVENQKKMRFNIYQGESLDVKDNLLLAQYEIGLPRLPKGEANVSARFSYDINGILDIEIKCDQNNATVHELYIENDKLSKKEISERLAVLDALKTSPTEEYGNNLLIARGKRLFEEFSGVLQAEIKSRLIEFESELEEGANPARLARLRAMLIDFFDRLDIYSDELLFYGEASEDDLFMSDE